MGLVGNSLQKSLSRRLMPLAYALAFAIGLIMLMTWGVLQVQITLAGFLNSESIWSKAQKQAVIDLDNYALHGSAADLSSFRKNLGLLLADQKGRDAITSGNFNQHDVTRVFKRGNIMPSAQTGMTFMLQHFYDAPHMKEALEAWRSTDSSVGISPQSPRNCSVPTAPGYPPRPR